MLLCCLFTGTLFCPERSAAAPAAPEERVYRFDDPYVLIEGAIASGESRNTVTYEVRLTPKPDWKVSVTNASTIKPLRIVFQGGKCLKAKGGVQFPAPDQAGTDESGSYSEYYTKTAVLRQEFSRLGCAPAGGFGGTAKLTYLLCQDNRCVGPFTREISFKSP